MSLMSQRKRRKRKDMARKGTGSESIARRRKRRKVRRPTVLGGAEQVQMGRKGHMG